jgi:hypothetical protein
VPPKTTMTGSFFLSSSMSSADVSALEAGPARFCSDTVQVQGSGVSSSDASPARFCSDGVGFRV